MSERDSESSPSFSAVWNLVNGTGTAAFGNSNALATTVHFSATGLYVLLAGEAAAVIDGAPVAHFQAGDVFGEISLIAGHPATATVVTLERSFVLQLPRSDFNEVIMTHPQVLEYLGSLADDRMQAIGKLKLL